jgi:hypothetical protein
MGLTREKRPLYELPLTTHEDPSSWWRTETKQLFSSKVGTKSLRYTKISYITDDNWILLYWFFAQMSDNMEDVVLAIKKFFKIN